MNAPRHAFVVPAYGDSPFLDDCLRSLREQTMQGSEIVVTTSTPSVIVAAAAARHAAALVINPERAGIATDWNFALTATRADLVTLAHQDDVYAPSYVEAIIGVLLRHPATLIAFCDAAEHTPDGPRAASMNVRVKRWLCARAFGSREYLDTQKDKQRLLAWGNPVNCPSVVFDRRKLAQFRFDPGFASNLDWDAWERLARIEGGFAYLRMPLVSHRVHPGSETTALIADHRRSTEDRRMFDRFWPRPAAAVIALIYRLGYLGNRL